MMCTECRGGDGSQVGLALQGSEVAGLDARRCCSGVDFCMKNDEAGRIRDKVAKLSSQLSSLVVGYMFFGCDDAKFPVVTKNGKNNVAYLVHSRPKGNHFRL